jgi:hypothetical protein
MNMYAIVKTLLALGAALALLGPAIASAEPISEPRTAQQAARDLLSEQDRILAPAYLFRNTADLFMRSYFAEFPASKNLGANNSKWQEQLTKFSDEMLLLMLPEGKTLEAHLAQELARQLTQSELDELLALTSSSELRQATERMKELGADWKVILKVQSVIKARDFYSEGEQQQVRQVINFMRGQSASLESAKEERAALLKVLNAGVFQKCLAALDETFRESVKRLQSTPDQERKFYALLQNWNHRLPK